MATTCQHCGATADNDARVMCPSCGRRMQPAGGASAPPPPPPEPPPAAPPPSPYAPPQPPPYVAPPPWAPPAPPPYGTPPPYATPTPYGAPPPYASPYAVSPGLPPAADVFFRRDAISRTSRVKVLFRLILALPHLIALYFIYIAAEVVGIVAWFAALFTARVPVGIYGFLAWVLSYASRVIAYMGLLTDRWPSFSETPDDAAFVRLAGPLPLNRAAVFFRLVLVFPAAFVAGLVGTGLAVAGFFVWLIVLVLGRVPQPVFDATAAVVRYHTRYYAYFGLLTARYPHGLFGDPQEQREPPAADPTATPTPPVVNRPARRLLVTFIVLGVVGFVLYVTLIAVFGRAGAQRQQADDDLAGAYGSMHITAATTCVGSSDTLACLQEAERQNASTLRTFQEDVSNIDFPGDTEGDVTTLRQSTEAYIADLDALSQATSLQEFSAIASTRDVEQAGRAVDNAVRQLRLDLETPHGP